jgi:hypothetical protein
MQGYVGWPIGNAPIPLPATRELATGALESFPVKRGTPFALTQ